MKSILLAWPTLDLEALWRSGELVHSGVLKRAQWIKYLGVFFNLDGPATDIYNTINTTFYNVAATIDTNISVGAPVLAFTDYYSFAPYFAYEISLATYKQQYASVSPSSLLTSFVCSMQFPRFINLLTLQSCTRTDVQVCIQFDEQEGVQCKKSCNDLYSSYLIGIIDGLQAGNSPALWGGCM